MLQVGDSENQYAIDVRHCSSIDLWPLFDVLEEGKIKLIGHNIKYDYKMLYTNFKVQIKNMMDTMIIEQVLNCGRYQYGYSLEKLTNRYLNIKYAKTNQLDLFGNQEYVGMLNKDTRRTFSKIGDKPLTYEQVIYGCKDVEHTLKIYFCQLEKIAESNLSKTVILESAFTRVLAHMELTGFYLDTKL
jgi:ribonuclease D